MHSYVPRHVVFAFLVLLFLAHLAHAGMVAAGQFAVDASGAATYSIPIKITPGIAGMEPNLTLSYNSRGRNGLLGMGWSIGGLPVITRCPQTIGQDKVLRQVSYDFYDRLCLDYQRLVPVAMNLDIYGKNGVEYRTELNNFVSIVGNGTLAYWDNSFTGTMQSGRVAEFGNTEDSKIDVKDTPTLTRAWALNKLTDLNGNYLTVAYTKDAVNGNFYPSRIDYTGTTSNAGAPTNSVQFFYATRPDVSPRYQAGGLIQDGVRLSQIIGFQNNNIAIWYSFAYDQEPVTGRSRLKSVTECSASACYPPTTFAYSNIASNVGNTIQSDLIDRGQEAGRAWVDANGDGKADYCRVIGAAGASRIACTLGILNGFGETVTSGILDPGAAVGRKWVDVNGDGRADYCRVIGSVNLQDSRVACTLSTSTGFGGTITSGVLDWGVDSSRTWVDFDGDGRADFCATMQIAGGPKFGCALSMGSGFGAAFDASLAFAGESPGSAWVDANGDGKLDACSLAMDQSSPAQNIVQCLLRSPLRMNSSPMLWGMDAGRDWVDINGDSRADFCRVIGSPGAYSLACALATDTSFVDTVRSGAMDVGLATDRKWIDINGDKKADYCRRTGSTNLVDSRVACTLSTGAGFGETVVSDVIDWGNELGRDWVDVNGDGNADFCRLTGTVDLQDTRIVCTLMTSGTIGITKITNGLGRDTVITYKPLTDPSVYTKDETAVYPQIDLQPSSYVVATVESPNGIGGIATTSYVYGGLKEVLGTGRGRQGFRWTQSTRVETGIAIRVDYLQDFPYTGSVSESRTSLSGRGNGGLLAHVVNLYACKGLKGGADCASNVVNGQIYAPFASQIVTSSWDLNGTSLPVTTTTTNTNDNGRYTLIDVSTSDGYRTKTENSIQGDSEASQTVYSTVTRTSPL